MAMKRKGWWVLLVLCAVVSFITTRTVFHNFVSEVDTFHFLPLWLGTGCLEADTKCQIAAANGNVHENPTHESRKSSLPTNNGSLENTNRDPTNERETPARLSKPSRTTRRRRPCAPWIPPEKRKVLFLDGVTYQVFHGFQKARHRGEDYVFAALDWALRQNGFQVDRARLFWRNGRLRVNDPHGPSVTKDTARTYHRVFLNGLEPVSGFPTPDLFCKLRNLHFWSQHVPPAQDAEAFVHVPEQIWVPYEDPHNTFAGYFVHALLEEFSNGKNLHNNNNNNNPRAKVGLVLGKNYDLIAGRKAIFQALVDAGFTLHVTAPCEQEEVESQETETGALDNKRNLLRRLANTTKDNDDTRNNKMTFGSSVASDKGEPFFVRWTSSGVQSTTRGERHSPKRRKAVACSTLLPLEGIIYHGPLSPEEYAALMYNVTFLLGTGDPILSPSPLVGLAHGVAFLNAAKDDVTVQHVPLKDLGIPYVYNYDLRDPPSAVQAANLAQKYPFPPFVPWAYRPEAMVDRVCAMMEDEAYYASCRCAQQKQHERNETPPTKAPLDCRASWYVRM